MDIFHTSSKITMPNYIQQRLIRIKSELDIGKKIFEKRHVHKVSKSDSDLFGNTHKPN